MTALRHSLLFFFTAALLASAAEPVPGTLLAQRAEALLASIQVTDYQHTTEIDERTGSFLCDCSGLVGYLLRHDFPWAYLSLDGKEAAWRTRPLSVTYYETFMNAGDTGTEPWLRIRKAIDARPGDILAWRKDEVIRGESTGHTLIIAGMPVLEPDGRVRLRVIDSTRRIHAEDTRPEGTTGVGAGVMWFAVNDGDEAVGYYVDGGGKPGTSTKIVIGRLNPAFHPTAAPGASPPEDTAYLGLTLRNATALAEKRGHPWRIVTERGKTTPVTLTINPERLNFALSNGIVTRVARG